MFRTIKEKMEDPEVRKVVTAKLVNATVTIVTLVVANAAVHLVNAKIDQYFDEKTGINDIPEVTES